MSADPDVMFVPRRLPEGPCAHVRQCPISGGSCPGECIFADVMESQRLGVVVFDLGGSSLLFVNRSAHDLFGQLQQSVEYQALHDLLLTPEPEADGDRPPRSLRLGSRLLGYTVYRARSFAWVYVRDITAKARLESIAEAVETMNNIGYVFAAVRHELGNPVNSVKAAVSVLRANLNAYSTDAVADYLDRIASEVGRVENLLRSLKSFSLYEQPELRPLDMAAFVEQFVKLVGDQARQSGITLETETASGCWAICDPRALQQVMLNLFANASDALRGREAPELRVLVGSSDGLVGLRMVDNGDGVGEEEARNLFKPFFTTKENGTGLGLVISRKLLAKMGGTITVESRPGRGTTVHLALPECPPCPPAA